MRVPTMTPSARRRASIGPASARNASAACPVSLASDCNSARPLRSWFPAIDEGQWTLVSSEVQAEEGKPAYHFEVWDKV